LEYFKRKGILEEQIKFVELYDNDHKEDSWVNVLDKGYRVNGAAWSVGGQFVLQPSFARSNRQFNMYKTIWSSASASDRGGNERAVCLAKLSGYLGNAKNPKVSIENLASIWLGWSFQCNFIKLSIDNHDNNISKCYCTIVFVL
jgi:hypothetical protein